MSRRGVVTVVVAALAGGAAVAAWFAALGVRPGGDHIGLGTKS